MLNPCRKCGQVPTSSGKALVEPDETSFVRGCSNLCQDDVTGDTQVQADNNWNVANPSRLARETLKSRSVQPPWCSQLLLQQQSVLFLATRGPDGVGKHHPCKAVQRAYRACVLLAGKFGRCLLPSEPGDSFMSLREVTDPDAWPARVREFFEVIDSLPHHYLAHLMHGAQILGYKHPDADLRGRWHAFYLRMVDDLHLRPEGEAEMDERLSDWKREFWHLSSCRERRDEEPGRGESGDGDAGDESDYEPSSLVQGEEPDSAVEELEAQVYEESQAEESRNSEYACCECGFVNARGDGHHRGGRCPHTVRCGWCGGSWPCAEHGPKGRAE